MAKFIQSEKGKDMLLTDEFIYVKDKQVKSKIYWKCQRFAGKCKKRAITIDGRITSTSGKHNHPGNSINVEVRKFLDKVKTEAKTTRDSPHYIMSNASSELSCCVAAALPQTSSIKRTIRRARQEQQRRSTVNDRKGLIILEDTRTNQDESSSVFNSGEKEEDRMLNPLLRNMAEFIQSEKGKDMLLLDGFIYVKDKQAKPKIYWKCKRFAGKCNGRVITIDGRITSTSGKHNHSENLTNEV